jgi:hypothetical protein
MVAAFIHPWQCATVYGPPFQAACFLFLTEIETKSCVFNVANC